MNLLLDTDTCVFALRGQSSVRQHLAQVGPEAIAISVITLAELRYGAACSARPAANQRAIDDFVQAIAILGIDSDIVRTFGDLKAELRQRGALLEDFDLLIAATAQTLRLTLVTNNLEHFRRIPGLAVETWV